MEIFDLMKVPIRIFESHSCLTGVMRHLSNMNVVFNFCSLKKLGKYEQMKLA